MSGRLSLPLRCLFVFVTTKTIEAWVTGGIHPRRRAAPSPRHLSTLTQTTDDETRQAAEVAPFPDCDFDGRQPVPDELRNDVTLVSQVDPQWIQQYLADRYQWSQDEWISTKERTEQEASENLITATVEHVHIPSKSEVSIEKIIPIIPEENSAMQVTEQASSITSLGNAQTPGEIVQKSPPNTESATLESVVEDDMISKDNEMITESPLSNEVETFVEASLQSALWDADEKSDTVGKDISRQSILQDANEKNGTVSVDTSRDNAEKKQAAAETTPPIGLSVVDDTDDESFELQELEHSPVVLERSTELLEESSVVFSAEASNFLEVNGTMDEQEGGMNVESLLVEDSLETATEDATTTTVMQSAIPESQTHEVVANTTDLIRNDDTAEEKGADPLLTPIDSTHDLPPLENATIYVRYPGRDEYRSLVPWSALEELGYKDAKEVVELQPETLRLIAEERLPRPSTGIPQRWKMKVDEKFPRVVIRSGSAQETVPRTKSTEPKAEEPLGPGLESDEKVSVAREDDKSPTSTSSVEAQTFEDPVAPIDPAASKNEQNSATRNQSPLVDSVQPCELDQPVISSGGIQNVRSDQNFSTAPQQPSSHSDRISLIPEGGSNDTVNEQRLRKGQESKPDTKVKSFLSNDVPSVPNPMQKRGKKRPAPRRETSANVRTRPSRKRQRGQQQSRVDETVPKRRKVYSGRPEPARRPKDRGDPPPIPGPWPDIDSFRGMLRDEARLRLWVLGDDWQDVVRDESNWRLGLYKNWLWTLHNGIGDPIVESRSDRMRRKRNK